MSVIDDKYAQLANAAQLLGSPVGPEGAALNGGRFRHYQFGSIYWSAATGAHEINGDIHARYAQLGFEASVMGYPTTDETPTPDQVGRYNHFQGGSLYWRPAIGGIIPATGAHEVHGPIHPIWAAIGWELGPGYPTTDVTVVPAFGGVQVSWFTNAIIAAPPSGPAFIVDPAVGALLVIAPNDEFAAVAQSFVDHKRSTGIPAFLHVAPPIEVRDLEHQAYFLKGLIASAAASLGVRWVMLLGDASLIPTAHRCTTHIREEGHFSTAWYSPTDFYYADLWPGGIPYVPPTGAAPGWAPPDTWDANRDSRLDEHHWAPDSYSYNPDNVQAIPWVAVGRVPAHTLPSRRPVTWRR